MPESNRNRGSDRLRPTSISNGKRLSSVRFYFFYRTYASGNILIHETKKSWCLTIYLKVFCVFWSYNLTSGFACVNANQVGVLCGDYKVRFTCPEEWCSSEWNLQAAEINVIFFVGLVWVYDIYSAVHLLLECRTPWFDRDNPGGQGDYETLSLTLVTYPLQVCSQPIAIEVATISGTPVLPAGNNFQVYDNVLFSMLKSLI